MARKACPLCHGVGKIPPEEEEETCPLCRGSGRFTIGCGSCHHFVFSPLSQKMSKGKAGYCTISLRRLIPGWPKKKGDWEKMGQAVVRVDHRCERYWETEREDLTFGSWWRKEWPTLK